MSKPPKSNPFHLIIGIISDLDEQVIPLLQDAILLKEKDFLAKELYFSEEVLKHSRKGQRIVKALFEHYEKELGAAGARDFIAGMTDRFAQQKAEELQLEF